MRTRRTTVLGAITASALGIGGLAAFATAAANKPLKLRADASALKYNVTKLSAKPGKVTLQMTNPGAIPHDIALKGGGLARPAKGKIVTNGGVSTATASVKAGKRYTFYCSVPGHEAAGMKGVLTVKQ
jgi:plastocyanin